jgi:hypothetical protein
MNDMMEFAEEVNAEEEETKQDVLRKQWQHEVVHGDTNLGYADWVDHKNDPDNAWLPDDQDHGEDIREPKTTAAAITHGSIAGQGGGNWGKVTVLTNGAILLENVSLQNIRITNCNIVGESGENPISFADRMNQLCDYIEFTKESPDEKLYAGHTHNFADPHSDNGVCICGMKKPEEKQ